MTQSCPFQTLWYVSWEGASQKPHRSVNFTFFHRIHLRSHPQYLLSSQRGATFSNRNPRKMRFKLCCVLWNKKKDRVSSRYSKPPVEVGTHGGGWTGGCRRPSRSSNTKRNAGKWNVVVTNDHAGAYPSTPAQGMPTAGSLVAGNTC